LHVPFRQPAMDEGLCSLLSPSPGFVLAGCGGRVATKLDPLLLATRCMRARPHHLLRFARYVPQLDHMSVLSLATQQGPLRLEVSQGCLQPANATPPPLAPVALPMRACAQCNRYLIFWTGPCLHELRYNNELRFHLPYVVSHHKRAGTARTRVASGSPWGVSRPSRTADLLAQTVHVIVPKPTQGFWNLRP
jgi:hypothetical protein